MLSALKRHFTTFFDAVSKVMHTLGFTPMVASLSGLVAAVGSSVLYYLARSMPAYLLWAAFLLLLSGFFDAVDGCMARLVGESSPFGGFADSMIDRLNELLVLSSIIIAGLCDLRWGLWSLGSSFLVSYSRSRGEMEGADMKVGIAERPERLLILVAATVVGQVDVGVAAIAVLGTITVLQRILRAYRSLARSEKGLVSMPA